MSKSKFILFFVALFYLVNLIAGSFRLALYDTPSNYTSYFYFGSLIACGLIYRKFLKIDYVEAYVVLLTIYGAGIGFLNGNSPFDIFKGCIATLPAIGLYRIGCNYTKSTTEKYLFYLFAVPEVVALLILLAAKYVFKSVYLGLSLTYLNTYWLIRYGNSKKLRIFLAINLMSGRRGNIVALILSWFSKNS